MQVELLHIYSGHSDAIYALSKGHTDNYFYSGSADQFVACWDVDSGTFVQPLVKSTGSIYALLHDHSHQKLYVGQRKGMVIEVDLTKEQSPIARQAHHGDIFDIQMDSKERIITAGGDGHIKFWKKADFSLLLDFKLSSTNVRCLHIWGNELLVGLSDHSIRVFDLDTLEQKQILEGHKNSVFTIAGIAVGSFISGGRDAMLLIWKKVDASWQLIGEIPAHLYTINHVSLSPNGQLLASASRDKSFKIWDAQTMKLLKVMDRKKMEASHSHSINKLLWLDDTTLLTTGDDKKIIAWRID